MREPRQLDPSLLLRVGGISALIAGALFFLTVAYAFGVMAGFGFAQEMFDDRALLLPWVADHAGLYRGLWLLYFASQVVLLPVPLALYTLIRQEDDARGSGIAAPCAVAGGAAVIMAMVGLVVIYTTSAPVARAFVEATPSSPEQASVLLLGDLFADVGKELRLFSELLLGVWLGGTGAVLLRRLRSGAGWAMLGIGACTLCVALLKILDPSNPLEDFLGLFLAGGYVVIGVRLLQSGARGDASRTAVESTAT